MTRIEPVGNTLRNYAAAVAGDDNVVSEEELSENGLPAPRDLPQIDDDTAASALELEAYFLGMASSHSQTVTIDQVDYYLDYSVNPDGEMLAACQTSATDVVAVRRIVQLIQMVMEVNRGLFEVTADWTVEGDPGNDASCADFAYSAATAQLISELSGDLDPMGRRPALADINIRAIAIRSGALSRPLINELFGTSGRTDVGAREGALQSLLGIGAIGDLPDPARIDELISKLNGMISALEEGSSYLPVLKDILIFAQILKIASQADTYIGLLFGLDEQGQELLADRTVALFSETVGTRLTANPGSRPDMAMVLSNMIDSLREALLQLTDGCRSILPPLPEVDGSDVAAWDSAWSAWAADAKRALNAQVRTTLPPIAQGTTEAEIVFTPMFVKDINSITPAMIAIVDAAGQPVDGIQVTNVSVDGDRLKISITIDEGVSLGNYSIRLIDVGSWFRPQMSVVPSVSADLVMTPESQDIEIAGFRITFPNQEVDLEAVRQAAAAIRTAEAPVEDRWIDAGQGDGLEYSVSAYTGVGSTPGVNMDVVGLADSESVTPIVGADASFGASFLADNYRFRLGLLSRGLYEGGADEGDPQTGSLSLAASVTGGDLFPSFYPDFNLGFGYRHLWNDSETPSHPAGDELSVGLNVEEVFPLTSHVGLGITTGMEAAWSVGDSRYGWERYDVPAVGARFRFSSSDANLDLALSYLYSHRVMRESVNPAFGAHSATFDGQGLVAEATLETGETAGNFEFSALYLDDPETVDVDLRYRYPFSWGSVGGSVGYESEDYLGPVVSRVPFSVSAEGEVTPGVELFGRLEGGPVWLDTPEGAMEPDQSGGYFGITIGSRVGSRSSITEDLIDVAPTASAARLAEESARDINNAIALRYLLAFKMGVLDANYELDEEALDNAIREAQLADIDAAYTEVDRHGPYGYGEGAVGGGTLMPPRGDSVSLGDVAPVVCYLGTNPILAGIDVNNYMPADPQYHDDFEDQLYVFEGRGDKQRVLNVGQSRHAVIEDEGITVQGVQAGTTLAGDLLGAVMVMAEDVEHHISRAGVEFFLSLLHSWDELGTYFGGTREEFIEQLLTELRGEVVGKAVMAVAKWVLGVSDLESLDEGQVEQVMAKAYTLRLSMLREPEETRAEEVSAPVPAAEEAPAVEPAAPAVTEEPDIVPTPPEERTI